MNRPARGGDPAPTSHLRVLYVSYLALDDPLVHTQVVAYLEGLSGLGHVIHLLTFETTAVTRARRREARSELARRGIAWHSLRYHKRPTLPATLFDVLCGSLYAAWLVHRHRLDAFHARNHVPAAMSLIAGRFASFRFVFDLRGLMAEEYEDAGRWRRGSLAFRLTKVVERRMLDRADATVVLTERVSKHLFGTTRPDHVRVIPCCANVQEIATARTQRAELRSRLGLEDRTVLLYVGKFTGWYMEREMVEFFALAQEQRPNMHFLVLTQSDPKPIDHEFARLGIDDSARTITRCAPSDIGKYLAAADAAIAFIRPSFSKISSSPTKVGEYLAAGLPMASISGVGDVDELLRAYRVGILLDGWSSSELGRGAKELLELMADQGVAQRARAAARERLSLTGIGIPAYHALYRGLSSR